MMCRFALHLIASIGLINSAFAQRAESQAPQRLSGFSYWEMSAQIEFSSGLCDALEVSPAQWSAVKEMRREVTAKVNREDLFLQVVGENQKELEQQLVDQGKTTVDGEPLSKQELRRRTDKLRMQGTKDLLFGSREKVNLLLDDETKPGLEKILSESQMDALYPTLMRVKFSSGLKPFLYKSSREFCGVGPETFATLFPLIEETNDDYQERIKHWRIEAGQLIVATLPASLQQRFVNCFGNSLAPRLQAPADEEPVHLYGLILHGTRIVELKPLINLSAKQVQQIEAIEEAFSLSLRTEKRREQSTEDFYNERNSKRHEEFKGVLSPTQYAFVCRQTACDQLLRDLERSFSDKRLHNYLELNAEQWQAISKLAATEERKIAAKVCELDAEVFERLCEKLEPDEKEKMQKVFKDIWPISVPNVQWFGSPFE